MSPENNRRIDAIAENSVLKLVARFAIPPLATAAMTVGGWYLSQQNETLRRVEAVVNDTKRSHDLLNQSIDLRAQARNSQITIIERGFADHEGRLRILERPVR